MTRVRLRRLFWIGAAGLLGAAALVSLVAILRGEFTETDGKILGTLGAAFLAGSTSLAGTALIERRLLPPLGWIIALGGLVGLAVLTWQVWTEFSQESWSLDTVTLLVAGLMLATARLLLRDERLAWLFWTSAALTSIAAVAFVWAIHAEPDTDGWAKALGALGVVTVLAWFLVPVLGRTLARDEQPATERVVARGPGRHEVELLDGEVLVVRSGG